MAYGYVRKKNKGVLFVRKTIRIADTVKRMLVILCCIAALFTAHSEALAAPVSAKALGALPKKDPTYFYMGLQDAREFALRLQRSELIRLLAEIEPEFDAVRDFLKKFPVDDIAVLFSDGGEDERYDARFQLTMRFDPKHRPTLDKIAQRTATKEDCLALFSDKPNRFLEMMRIHTPEEAEEPYYELSTFDLYFTAHEDLLLFGESPERLKASLAAAKSSTRRFKLEAKGPAKNTFYMNASKELTEELLGSAFYLDEQEGTAQAPQRMTLEGEIKLVPGGWNLDLFTNAATITLGKAYEKKMYSKPANSFFSAGGGQLLAALDSTPDLTSMTRYSGGPRSAMRRFVNECIDEMSEALGELIGEQKTEELQKALFAVDRINVGITNDPTAPTDVRMYMHLSSQEQGVTPRAGEILSEIIEKYNQDAKNKEKFVASEQPGWTKVYALTIPEELSEITKQDTVSVAMGEHGILFGLMSSQLIGEKFNTASALFAEATAKNNLKEIAYFDAKSIRKFVTATAKRGTLSRSTRKTLTMLIVPFLDFHEISAETLSLEHFTFRFKTGWLDFEDRDFVKKLLR